MNTKRTFAIVGILMLLAVLTRAAEPILPVPPEATASYYGSEFSLDIATGAATTDFNDERGFAGFGVNWFFDENFGIGASTSFDETSGQFFENLSLKGIYRVPVGRSALYGFAGGLRELERDKWGVTLGIGGERRLAKYLAAYLEVSMEKFVDIDPVAVGKVGIRIPLSLK